MQRGGNQVGGINAQQVGGRVSAVSAREANQATDVVTGTFTICSVAVNVYFFIWVQHVLFLQRVR